MAAVAMQSSGLLAGVQRRACTIARWRPRFIQKRDGLRRAQEIERQIQKICQLAAVDNGSPSPDVNRWFMPGIVG